MKTWHKVAWSAALVLAGVVFADKIRALPMVGSKIPSF